MANPLESTHLRRIISEALSDDKHFEKIKNALSYLPSEENTEKLRREALNILRSRGIVDSVIDSVFSNNRSVFKGGSTCEYKAVVREIPFRSRAVEFDYDHIHEVGLRVDLIRGKAFIGHLETYKEFVEEEQGIVKSTVIFYASCNNKRFRSRPVPYTSDMDVNECFFIPLEDKYIDPQHLLLKHSMSLLNIVCVSRECCTGRRQLVARASIDWRRYVFPSSSAPERTTNPWGVQFSLELQSPGPDSKMTVGILELCLTILWPTVSKDACLNVETNSADDPHSAHQNVDREHLVCGPNPLPLQVVEAQLGLESARSSQRERSFVLYARQWWREFTQLREGAFAQRVIKIFANDENGCSQFVCSFIRPLSGHRILETPSVAARFVATIPCEAWHGVGAGPKEQWCSALAFVTRNRGDVPDHANLLCSLLLGFGLNAYVAIGTRQSSVSAGEDPDTSLNQASGRIRHHAWVVVLQMDPSAVLFWDPISGRRYVHQRGTPPAHPYQTVGCMYNHRSFYANIQPTDHLFHCCFDVNDSSSWRAMSSDVISSVVAYSALPLVALNPPYHKACELSDQVEIELRTFSSEWRSQRVKQSADTWFWDRQLSQALTPVLAGFEADQLRPPAELPEDTLDIEPQVNMLPLRQYVPEGFTFKAYPIQLLHTNARRILSTCLRSRLCRDILSCQGDHVRLGLRVRCYSYAEEAIVTWVMFACVYKAVL
ncbi:unnamed protein product [Calicophoron daubneyi]|uniref:Centrosomal protein of 76 kDa n=1 Tax=Calicophoron daubneyi TaxID=300641 RepID=A0AAV2TNE2_CALDB